jgi:diguanylate cyclase (GGDEF)-like protein/putative nucleotidyltransferase with HDIG domain
MHQVSPDQRPKGKDIHTTLKFLVLFISIIPVLQKCIDFFSEDELVYFNIAKMIIFFVVITLAAVFWFIINYAFKNERVRLFFEVAVMYGVCLLCYISTGAATSSYKFIFALVIILYSINLGIRFGVGFSFVSGATIMIVDSLTIGEASRSHFFQADIILLGAFCMTAYTVGYYAEKDRKQIRALSDAVNRDSLTYLYNHRYFYDVMRKAIQNPPFGKKQYVMIMDIDYFKVYNDNPGHQKGDIALCRIAEISRSMFGDEFVFRYGGEEFAVYMLADDDNEAFVNANELRTIVENFEFEGQYMQPGHNLTVSIGVAGRRDGGDTIADWIERADNALYKAKSFHRNRVQMYSSVFDRFDHLDQVSDDEQMISIKTLLSVINTRDRYTYNHTDRVVHFCEAYSKYAKLSEEQSRLLLHSAYLHDIGKINVPQEILISEKKLTDEEWALMKRHPLDGAEIVRKIHNMETVADIVEQHHEKYNGTGYPYGKKEDQLHVLARVLTLADSFDAMTAKRPYQKSKTFEEAFAEIRRCKGTQFDPELAEQFIEAIENSYF